MAPATSPGLHSRLCALATAASCVVHVWVAGSGGHGAWIGLLMVALAAVCVPCTVHIWRHGRVRALRQVTAAAVAMAGLHAVLLLGAGGGGHAHGGGPPSFAPEVAGSSQLLLVIGLELTTALLAATLVARLRRQAWVDQPGSLAGSPALRGAMVMSATRSSRG